MKIQVSGKSWLKAVTAAHGKLQQDVPMADVAKALNAALTELQYDWEVMT